MTDDEIALKRAEIIERAIAEALAVDPDDNGAPMDWFLVTTYQPLDAPDAPGKYNWLTPNRQPMFVTLGLLRVCTIDLEERQRVSTSENEEDE
ncbi:MAG: hypothetical protein E6R03_12740 [Hyphomicrobiaceae bacterium]|nr:MAG: hypothetical protein E6R03_12740 [Hyphomicrobiaceae bacterium]